MLPTHERDSLVTRTARALSDLSMASDPDSYLGSEDELLARLGVSRPTLRQAAKIVESERLLSVRRGVKGGFYAERPNAQDAIRSLTRFLRLRGATIRHVGAATRLIVEEMATTAAHCDDADLRARLLAFRDRIGTHDSAADMVRDETEMARLIAEMSGNPAIELFIEIGYMFGREDQNVSLYRKPEDRERTRALQRGLCDAILAGDADIARLMIQRRAAMLAAWLNEDAEAEAV